MSFSKCIWHLTTIIHSAHQNANLCHRVNIQENGVVHSPLLNFCWNETMDIKTILIHIQNLLAEPSCEQGFFIKPYELYCMDQPKYEKTVLESIKVADLNPYLGSAVCVTAAAAQSSPNGMQAIAL